MKRLFFGVVGLPPKLQDELLDIAIEEYVLRNFSTLGEEEEQCEQ